MSSLVISIEQISKLYRLGEVGTGSLAHDVNRWWHLIRGRDDPYAQVGQVNDRTGSRGRGDKSGNRKSKHENSEYVWALKDINFNVEQGEVLGIIGRNGAGKSTLLKILSRVTAPTNGHIKVKGRIAALLEVGTGFHHELTGRANIYLNAAILGMRKSEVDRKLDEIVDFSGCAAYLDTPVKRYSSGMQLRLAFAVAAHLEPEILIVDEVLAVGDLAFQRKCLGKMDEVARGRGATVLFVSHQLPSIRRLCSRALVLEQGSIIEDNTVEASLASYYALNNSTVAARTALPPGESDAPAQALSIHTENVAGQSCASFCIGEPWRAILEFEVTAPLPQVVAAIGLNSADGISLVTWWSTPQDLAPGRYYVEFVCDIRFSASWLNFAVGISTNERSIYFVTGVGNFNISDVAIGDQPVRAYGAGVLSSSNRPTIHKFP
jgi:lipopolysaccharide transport system ATP-binding protein